MKKQHVATSIAEFAASFTMATHPRNIGVWCATLWDTLQNELNTVIYDETNGTFLHPVESKFPIQAVVEGAVVVVAGFLP